MGTHQQYYNGRRPPFHGGFVLEFFQTALSKPGIKVYQFGPANQATPCSLLQFPPFSFPDQSSSPRLVIPPNAAAPSLMSSNWGAPKDNVKIEVMQFIEFSQCDWEKKKRHNHPQT